MLDPTHLYRDPARAAEVHVSLCSTRRIAPVKPLVACREWGILHDCIAWWEASSLLLQVQTKPFRTVHVSLCPTCQPPVFWDEVRVAVVTSHHLCQLPVIEEYSKVDIVRG